MIHSEILVKRHCVRSVTHSLRQHQKPDLTHPALLIGRALERGQQIVPPALLAQLDVVTLPKHTAEVNGPLLSRVQQINAQVPASMRRELFAHHLISATQTE